jgi:shikimate 5-dehydrogenase
MVVIYTIDHKIDNLDSLNFSKSYIFEANYKNPNLKTLDCINYIGGEEWLINQAIPAFKLFTGIEPNLDAINKVINRD